MAIYIIHHGTIDRMKSLFIIIAAWFMSSSAGEDSDRGSSCYRFHGNLLCYETGKIDQQYLHLYDAFAAAEAKYLTTTLSSTAEAFKTSISCQKAADENYRLVDRSKQIDYPLILIQPQLCVGAGNIIGFFFELFSFGMTHNIAVGRISGHANRTSESCDSGRNMAQLFRHMPQFMIPANVVKELPAKLCKNIPEWPWEHRNPYYLRYPDLNAKLNNRMIMGYLAEDRHRRDGLRVFTQSLVIHFRCSDNLAHQYMGLLPYSQYNQTLQQIANHPSFKSSNPIRSVVIYTDARLHASHGEICVRALAEFEYLIRSLPAYKQLDLMVHRTTTAQTYAMLHLGKVLFCSASTLCFFAAFGNEHAYIPIGKGVVITLPSYDFKTNFTFIQTRVIRPAFEAMPADQFAKVFINT